MEDVKGLIPHREPFLLVDEIVSADEETITGVKTFGDSFFIFSEKSPERKIVPEVLLIEAMAQCGGAGAKKVKMLKNEGFFVLAMIESARFHDNVEPGKAVTMVVKNLKVRNKGIKQSGTAHSQGKLIAEATWWCVKLR